MQFRNILVLGAALALSACVSVKHRPLDAAASAQLQGKTVTTTRYETADFAAMTAGKAAFGMIGGAAMVVAGNNIVEENGIADPAIAIGDELVRRLTTNRGMVRVESATVADGDKPAELLAAYPQGDYLLDVKTIGWMFLYYPTDWAHYRLIYSARLRVINRSTGQVVAETLCQANPNDDANPPTREELLADRAALLKEKNAQAAQQCSDVLANEILGLAGAVPAP